MANKKKQANPGTVQFNKFISELPEKREKIKAQIGFRYELLESQKRINYQNEFDRLQGAKKLPGLDANAKSRMKGLQKKTKQSLNGEPSHRIYSTKFKFIIIYIMGSYHKRKRLLEEKYGKLVVVKPFNGDIGRNTVASHRQQK